LRISATISSGDLAASINDGRIQVLRDPRIDPPQNASAAKKMAVTLVDSFGGKSAG